MVIEKLTPLIEHVRYKGAWGGRGGAKSHYYAEQLVEDCFLQPIRAVCIREIQLSLKQSVKLLIEDKIRNMGLSHLFDCKNDQIDGPNDSIIVFSGMQNHTAESIKSYEGFNRWWFEEAHKASQNSLDMIRPTLRSSGAEFWASWNPVNSTDPIDQFFRGKHRPRNSVVVETNWRDNPFFPPDLDADRREDMVRDYEKYLWVWEGRYRKIAQAAVFRNWRTEEFETPADAQFFFGCDWGFAKDPTVLVRMFIVGRTLFIDQEVWEVGCEIDYTPALFAGPDTHKPARWPVNPNKGHLGIPGSTQWPLVADSADPQNISFMRRHGFLNMRPSIKGPNSVEQGVEFLQGFDIVVHKRCLHVQDELANYSYVVDEKVVLEDGTHPVLPILADKKNHTIDSIRYGIEPLRRSSTITVVTGKQSGTSHGVHQGTRRVINPATAPLIVRPSGPALFALSKNSKR